MKEIEKRLRELQALTSATNLDTVERVALYFLHTSGIETLESVVMIPADNKDRWVLWACDSLVFCARELRAKRYREAMRGWGQVREYLGRNGGFFPAPLSDHVGTIQNALEDIISPR